MSIFRYAAATAVLVLLAAGPASADGIAVSGETPLVCSAGIVGATAVVADPSSPVAVGQLNEFCNDPSGYDVWIDYPTTLTDASLLVDGQTEPLSAAGTVLVNHASGPGQASLTLALNAPSATGPVPLTVRMVPVEATALALASIAP